MADIDVSQGQGVPITMVSKYVDMGDGTHALQVAVGSTGGSGTIPVTGPLTDAQLRALAVAVSGPLTDAELRATPVPTVLTAGEAHAGEFGGRTVTRVINPVITAGAYQAGDAVGDRLDFPNAVRAGGPLSGILMAFLLVDDAAQDAGLELWLFNQPFTAMVDNAAWNPSEADLENWIGTVRTADSREGYLTATGQSVVKVEFTLPFTLVGATLILYGQLVTPVDTPTYVATDDITVKTVIMQD